MTVDGYYLLDLNIYVTYLYSNIHWVSRMLTNSCPVDTNI